MTFFYAKEFPYLCSIINLKKPNMKKYTLITNNNIIINDIEIDINDSQVIRLIESTGATLFESEYNKDYFFINATTEQIKILNTLDCITAIEQYDESYFIVLYTIKK